MPDKCPGGADMDQCTQKCSCECVDGSCTELFDCDNPCKNAGENAVWDASLCKCLDGEGGDYWRYDGVLSFVDQYGESYVIIVTFKDFYFESSYAWAGVSGSGLPNGPSGTYVYSTGPTAASGADLPWATSATTCRGDAPCVGFAGYPYNFAAKFKSGGWGRVGGEHCKWEENIAGCPVINCFTKKGVCSSISGTWKYIGKYPEDYVPPP